MSISFRSAGTAVGIGLIVSVLTQAAYMAFLGGPGKEGMAAYMINRWTDIAMVWTTEVAAFSVIAVAGIVAAIRGAPVGTAWVALAIAALFNALQAGIGLSLFKPLALAGADFSAITTAVVAGAFFFYFLAKAMIGCAAVGFGLLLLKSASMPMKALAAIGIITGLAAAVINIAALPQGMTLTFMAGASGTLATLVCGIMALVIARQSPAADAS